MTAQRPFPAYTGSGAYVVVCYAHLDAGVVYPEIAWLHEQGINIWYDEGIRPGHEFPSELAGAIDRASALLFYGSPRSVASRHCRDEIFYALDHRKPVISSHLEHTVLPAGLALQMGSIQALLRYQMRADDYRRRLLASVNGSLEVSPTSNEPAALMPHQPRGARRRRHALIGGVAVAALAAVGTVAVYLGGLRTETVAPIAPLLAVLPLNTEAAAPEHSWLADGMTAVLIGQLDRVQELRVVSLATVMRYGGTNMSDDMPTAPAMPMAAHTSMPGNMGMASPPAMSGATAMAATGTAMNAMAPKSLDTIVRELNADYVMQGRLATRGEDIEVAVTVFDARLNVVWESGPLVRDRRELVNLETDLAAGIATAVVPGSTSDKSVLAAAHQPNPAAHQAYLRGIYYQTHWRLPESIESYQRAIQLDPDYASAYAHLARAHYFHAFFGDVAPAIALGEMQRAAATALEKDPQLAEGHAQMALVRMLLEWNWEAAQRGFVRALELSPSNAQIRHDFAHLLLAMGLQDASLEQTHVAIALDPANPMLTSCLGWHSLFNREFQQAIEYAAESNKMMPDFWAQVVLGWAHLGRNEPELALAALREGARLSNGGFATAALAHGLAVTGQTAEAHQVLDGLLARAEDEYVSAYDIATVYAGLGDADQAFRWLRRAADERAMFIVHLGWDARFASLRGDSRYRTLVADRLALPIPGQGLAQTSATDQTIVL